MEEMQHYIDLKIILDPCISESHVMNKLFSRLHIALVEQGTSEVGVSFPQAKKTLGSHLRLHGSKSLLEQLMSVAWIGKLEEYLSISLIKKIPSFAEPYIVKRIQTKSNAERMRRRSVKKGWLTQEEANQTINREVKSTLPYVEIQSHSTGKTFKLFVEQKLQNKWKPGKFSYYGLSNSTTIPWF